MLLVIFGAGASYDSWPSFPPARLPRNHQPSRPPLAKELFLDLEFFRRVSLKYSRCQPLLTYLESQENIEAILDQFRLEAEERPWRRKQLLAMRYYIRDVIRNCQVSWLEKTYRVTNYRTLVDQVEPLNDVCFVTFNYDILLENALEAVGVRFPCISSYVSGDPKVFKLHGSTDWRTWIPAQLMAVHQNQQPSDEQMIEAAPNLLESAAIIVREDEHLPPTASELHYSLPALAIPVASKSSFFCPLQHIEALKDCIQRVDRIAIIGWRASEQNFLAMLAEGLRPEVPVIVACGKEEDSNKTLQNLESAGIRLGRSTALPDGFTDLARSRKIEDFLRPTAHSPSP